MSQLRITDNHDFISIHSDNNDRYRHSDLNEEDCSNLQKIANIEIGNLSLTETSNLLVFPQDFNQYGDKISESSILSMREDEIATGNIMGFVGVNDTQVDICSRFAKENEDYFLHYMLQKVFAINLFDIKHTTTQESIFDFLIYLFPNFLKKALAQGVFKKYQRFEHNDANIRGPINVSRHIQENIPFRGTVAYTTREHSYDNEVTQLVRHTIEYIRSKENGRCVLNCDSQMKDAVLQIVLATPSYMAQKRTKVINANLRPVRHPYYSEYTSLQKICLQILRHESLKYGQEKDKVYGVLFDGAWLWEEYLNCVFTENKLNITHAENKIGQKGIPLYQGGQQYYPDFYRKVDGDAERSFVLDAKYKRLGFVENIDGEDNVGKNHISIQRGDLFQMISYMHCIPAMHCALLYPLEKEESDKKMSIVRSESRISLGYGGEILGFGLPIVSKTETFNDFLNEMRTYEIGLSEKIMAWIKQ